MPGKYLKNIAFKYQIILILILIILPFMIQEFYVYMVTSIFVTALLAMSLNMLVGYGGLYQFHHSVFYGVGAYTVALLCVKTAVPFWIGFILAPLVSALTGFFIGWFCVRLTSLYFGMLQISLGSLIWAIAFRWYSLTGADDGLHGIPVPGFLKTEYGAYYFILFILVICVTTMYLILKSPFGITLQAVRDNPERCEAIGINVRRHQLAAIVIATGFAGVAGALYVTLEQSVFPDLMFWVFSLEIFIMCLLGGWFTFSGPMLGAAIIITLRTFVGIYTEYWTLILGIILILIIFFLPEGVMGFITDKILTKKSNESGREKGIVQ